MQRYESAMSWRAHNGEVYSVEFSYDENTVFSVGEDGKVKALILDPNAEVNNNDCCCLQFIQWNIHRCGVKQSEQDLPQDATGPFILSGYSGYKQVQVPRGRLFAFDSEGQHVLTCSSSGGLIYRVCPPLSPPSSFSVLVCFAAYRLQFLFLTSSAEFLLF